MEINWLEVKRKSFHLIAGIIIVILLNLNLIGIAFLFLVLVAGIIFSIIAKFYPNSFFNWFLEHFDRDSDRNSIPGRGALTYLAGMVIALILFQKDIALASILIMVVGDAVSPIVGMHFAKTKHIINQKKLVEGTIAGVFFAFLAALFFVSYLEAFLAAITAMFIETIEFKYFKRSFFDDNIIMPITAGLVIYLIRLL